MPEEKIKVMVNGLPGKMASKVVEHISENRQKFSLVDYSLTGQEIEQEHYGDNDLGVIRLIKLIKPDKRDSKIEEVISKYYPFISVDFTHPDAVNSNGYFYCRNNLPFVLGTTGGDRKALEERVMVSDISAVIAPNMAKQIVAFQALMENSSKEEYSGVLKDCRLNIVESHQQGKKDTSGTARAMVKYFNNFGIPFTEDKINMIREPKKQLEIGVPEGHLAGHGWHRYIISSKQGNDNIAIVALGLKGFLLTDGVFSDYNCFSKRPQTEGNWIIWNRSPIEEIMIDDNIMDRTYRISKDRTVGFSLEWFSNKLLVFNHNVNGRDIYASGTLDAIKYLDKKVKEGSKGQVYSMIDVLKGK
jgi:4-hydroxy-tetrahydrodipicolinate reductase